MPLICFVTFCIPKNAVLIQTQGKVTLCSTCQRL